MTSYPSISVVVLSHNSHRYVDECFTSLQQLDYPAALTTLVLADNASVDGTVEYVQEHFPTVNVIRLERNYGFSEGNNRAVKQLDSEYVAFLNPDMRVTPSWLTELVAARGDEPDVVCTGSKILNHDGTLLDFGGALLSFLGHGRADGYHEADLTAYDQVHYILGPCGGAMLIDREVFLACGGFDEDFFAYFEDLDLGWRLWISGYKVVFAPRSICYHHHFGSSSQYHQARIQYLYERNALYTILKNYEQTYLERVLPLALMLLTKRAYYYGQLSGVDMDACRLNPSTTYTPPAQPQPYDWVYYWRETWHTLRHAGLRSLARKIRDEIKRRRGQPISQLLPAEARIQQQALFWYQQAHIAAANDVVDTYPQVMAKRQTIQASRKRSDREIFSTVRALSFDVCFDTPAYQQAQQTLLEQFQIADLFGPIYDPEIPFALRPKEDS